MSKSIEFLRQLATQLQTQDNAYTASPNYCIQEHVLITGIDEDYTDNIGFFDCDGNQAEGKELEGIQARYDENFDVPDGWTRCGYDRIWRHTGICFLTYAAAQAYCQINGHRHEYPIRVYVDSHYRNREMREVRRLLAGPIVQCLDMLQAMLDEDDGGMEAAGAKAALAALDTAKEPHQ